MALKNIYIYIFFKFKHYNIYLILVKKWTFCVQGNIDIILAVVD